MVLCVTYCGVIQKIRWVGALAHEEQAKYLDKIFQKDSYIKMVLTLSHVLISL